jgi:hypothetical protein
MKISKTELKNLIREVMTGGPSYGQGMGIGHPSTANAVEISGGQGAPVLGWTEIDEIKDVVTKRVMYVLKDYVTTTGDAYEILTVIVNELEDKMAHEGYIDNGDELQRFLPLQERRKRSKRSS